MFEIFAKPKDIKASRIKWAFLMAKRSFETGYSLTNYIKYLIALFGLSSLNVSKTMTLALIYAMFCFLIGWLWYKYRFADVESEISNVFNPFIGEMREMKNNVENEKNSTKKKG